MESKQLLKRLHDIEREMSTLKADLAPNRSFKKVLSKAGMFLVSYWALMSFFAALATATYVKFAFNIDYFESYRNASAVKRLSDFHRQMGDEMFLRLNWKQAQASYKAATAANPANTIAALGEVKAGVLLPEDGQKFTDPSISALKLGKLRELYPDDPQVAFLDAMHTFNTGTPEDTLAKCDALLARHKTFPGGYLLKSYVQQSKADFKGSIASLEMLLKIDPNDGQAHSNLGYSYLLTGRTKDALKHLETGLTLYPAMVNAISLAEACRMTGEIEKARALVTSAERTLDTPGIEQEYLVSGQWLWNHLPERDGDTESFKSTITCGSLDQKRAVLRITQGMLAATDGDEKAALDHFREVLKLEPHYRAFLINKLRATVHAGVAPEAVKARMTAYADALAESAASR